MNRAISLWTEFMSCHHLAKPPHFISCRSAWWSVLSITRVSRRSRMYLTNIYIALQTAMRHCAGRFQPAKSFIRGGHHHCDVLWAHSKRMWVVHHALPLFISTWSHMCLFPTSMDFYGWKLMYKYKVDEWSGVSPQKQVSWPCFEKLHRLSMANNIADTEKENDK